MKSAEFRVLSAELKDRPQGAGYQPSPEKEDSAHEERGFYHSAKVLSTLSSYSGLRTQDSGLSGVKSIALRTQDSGLRTTEKSAGITALRHSSVDAPPPSGVNCQ